MSPRSCLINISKWACTKLDPCFTFLDTYMCIHLTLLGVPIFVLMIWMHISCLASNNLAIILTHLFYLMPHLQSSSTFSHLYLQNKSKLWLVLAVQPPTLMSKPSLSFAWMTCDSLSPALLLPAAFLQHHSQCDAYQMFLVNTWHCLHIFVDCLSPCIKTIVTTQLWWMFGNFMSHIIMCDFICLKKWALGD